jgi:tRNA(Ile)-lysidine synthase
MSSVSRVFGSPARAASSENLELAAPVVLMVSGGADSSALVLLAATSTLDLMDGAGATHIARQRLHILHVNHQLRGLDATEDEEFVRALGARWGIPVTVVSANVAALAAETPGESFEQVARELRYREANALATRLAKERGVSPQAARIVTAHTADDRCETFFMNAMRGTGVRGLTSIPRKRGRIVRPLLDRTHDDLCDLLRMQGIVWREDATNTDQTYLRNYVRHTIVPAARAKNPRLVHTVAATAQILSDEDAYLTGVCERLRRSLTRRQGPGLLVLDAGKLAATEVALARRVVRQSCLELEPAMRLEARHVNAVLELVAAGAGSVSLPLGLDARVVNQTLRLATAATQSEEPTLATWLAIPQTLEVTVGTGGERALLTAAIQEVPHGHDPRQLARTFALEWAGLGCMFDAELAGLDVGAPSVWVDTPQVGDVLCPFGMRGQSKRLSELLKNAHIAAPERAFVPVVRTSVDGPIIWVAGVRQDERFSCRAQTRWLVTLTLTHLL